MLMPCWTSTLPSMTVESHDLLLTWFWPYLRLVVLSLLFTRTASARMPGTKWLHNCSWAGQKWNFRLSRTGCYYYVGWIRRAPLPPKITFVCVVCHNAPAPSPPFLASIRCLSLSTSLTQSSMTLRMPHSVFFFNRQGASLSQQVSCCVHYHAVPTAHTAHIGTARCEVGVLFASQQISKYIDVHGCNVYMLSQVHFYLYSP